MTTTKSRFDTGNWSEVNGLPGQQDMVNFMEYLTSSDPNKCYTRRQLMDCVAKEFGIPATAQEAEGPKSNTPGYYTRLTYLISGAVLGKWKCDGKPFIKRLAPSVYQHISGNGEISPEVMAMLKSQRPAKVSRRLVEQAMVSVKILQELKWEPERIISELHTWDANVVEAAIEKVFA